MFTNKAFNKTRLAPTPSGFVHLGNAFSFALTAAVAAQSGARLLLRVDDLDLERTRPAYVEDVFETLRFLDIEWTEGPVDASNYQDVFSQVHRMSVYTSLLDKLRAAGQVFACDCTRSQILAISPDGTYPGTCLHRQLDLDAPGVCWRLRTAPEEQVTIRTYHGEPLSARLPASVQHVVVRKKDGMPAYQIASVADDLHFSVDLVVRGADLFDSTLAQVYIAQALNEDKFATTTFLHHRLISRDGEKLSKSAGSTSIRYLRTEGKSASEVYGMIGVALGLVGRVRHWSDLTGEPGLEVRP